MDINQINKELALLLKDNSKTLSVAESCTGGRISHIVSSVSGASNYYLGSVTSYAISIKNTVLNVDLSLIEEKGVVSSEVAMEMAEGVRKLFKSDYAVTSTGLADKYPDAFNPAGTVWIGFSSALSKKSMKYMSHKSRQENMEAFAVKALEFLLECIKEELNSQPAQRP